MSDAGWHADPAGSGRDRYWDGQKWTEQFRDRDGTPFAPPAAPSRRRRSKTGKFGRGCLMAIGAGTVAVVLLIVLLVVALSNSKTSIGKSSQTNVVGGQPSVATTGSAAVPATAGDSQGRQNIQITAKGFTQLPANSAGDSYVTYGIVVLNPNPAGVDKPWVAGRVALNVTFSDSGGKVLASESPTIDYVLPGQHMASGAELVKASGVASMTVEASVGDWNQNDRPITGAFTTSGIAVNPGSFGAKVTGTLTSTFASDYKNLDVAVIFVTGKGLVIGGSHTLVDFVPREGKVSFSVQILEPPPNITNTFVLASPSVLTTLNP
jgi:hypothetical protein